VGKLTNEGRSEGVGEDDTPADDEARKEEHINCWPLLYEESPVSYSSDYQHTMHYYWSPDDDGIGWNLYRTSRYYQLTVHCIECELYPSMQSMIFLVTLQFGLTLSSLGPPDDM
jgi:hypothetical protein